MWQGVNLHPAFYRILARMEEQMLSTQKLIAVLNEIKSITKLEAGVFATDGSVYGATFEPEKELTTVVAEFADSEVEQQYYQECQLFKILIDHQTEYILVTKGTVDNGVVIGQMAVCQLRNLIQSQEESFDRNNFIQNVLLGNLLTVDMYAKAKRLHIEAKPRVAFVIDTDTKSTDTVM